MGCCKPARISERSALLDCAAAQCAQLEPLEATALAHVLEVDVADAREAWHARGYSLWQPELKPVAAGAATSRSTRGGLQRARSLLTPQAEAAQRGGEVVGDERG